MTPNLFHSERSAHVVWRGLALSATVALIAGPGSTSRPATGPSSRPTSQTAGRDDVARLVRDLGSPRFTVRQAAQLRLSRMGDAVLPRLIPHVSDADPEVAARVAALIHSPADPALRVDLALRLMGTTNPDWIERAVHMLFETPAETCDLFIERAERARGVDRVLADPIAEEFRQWRQQERFFRRQYERIKSKDPRAAARLLKQHRAGDIYRAEAAYWSVVEALLDYRGAGPASRAAEPATRPTTRAKP